LPKQKIDRACLDHHIGRCDAPCVGLQTQEDYRAMIGQMEMVLEGKEDQFRKELEADMQACAKRLDFEAAARRRDQLQALAKLKERQRIDLAEAVDIDVVALVRDGRWGVVTWMEIRAGCVQGRHHETLSCPLSEEDSEVMAGAVVGRYLDRKPPPELLVSCLPDGQELLEEYLSGLLGRKVECHLARQGRRFRLAQLAHANAKMLLTEHLAHLEARERVTNSVKELQEALGLPVPPRRIEGFDISHLSGTGTVASMVVAIDGKPAKGEYRRFHVKTVEGIDDFASMREILGRRFRRIREEGLEPPDLVLIDGGKGQLGMAVEAMAEEGFPDQKVLGLAKRIEEVFLPGESEPRILPRTSASLQLLQRLRDEAHRFAITFQREQRTSTITASWLDGIKGVGPQKKQLLLQHFGSALKVKEAKEADLAQLVGPQIAATIVARAALASSYLDPIPAVLMAAEPSA
ncbi:MAG: excinuclease subunit UvrC, partial [Fibrobacterota bacterium]